MTVMFADSARKSSYQVHVFVGFSGHSVDLVGWNVFSYRNLVVVN